MIFQHHHHHYRHHPPSIAIRHSPMGCSRILVGGRPEAGWQESKWCFLGDPLACSSAHVEGLSVFCTFGVSHVRFLGHPDIDHDHNHDNNMPPLLLLLLLQNPKGLVSNQFCKHYHSWTHGSLSDCSLFFSSFHGCAIHSCSRSAATWTCKWAFGCNMRLFVPGFVPKMIHRNGLCKCLLGWTG